MKVLGLLFNKCLLIFCVAVFTLSTSACVHKGSAVAKCGSVLNGESRLGIINTPHYAIGSIVGLNSKTKKGFFVSAITIQDADKVNSPAETTYSSKFDQALNISFSANIPADTQASLTSYITNSSLLNATNLKRVSVKDIVSLINTDANIKNAIKNTPAPADGEIYYFVVSSILYADTLNVSLENATKVGADVNVVKVGNFKLNVEYKCSDALNVAGSQFGALFKITPIGFDAAKNEVFVNTAADIKLSDYDLSSAIMLR